MFDVTFLEETIYCDLSSPCSACGKRIGGASKTLPKMPNLPPLPMHTPTNDNSEEIAIRVPHVAKNWFLQSKRKQLNSKKLFAEALEQTKGERKKNKSLNRNYE